MSNRELASKVIFLETNDIGKTGSSPDAIAGLIGTAMKGPIGEAVKVYSLEEFVQIFGGPYSGSTLYPHARAFFEEGGNVLYVVRTVHYTDPSNATTITALKAAGAINSVSVGSEPARVVGTASEPFALQDGDTLVVIVDGGAPQTVTFNGTAANVTSGNTEPFNLSGGEDLIIEIDGSGTQTITIDPADITAGAATASEVANTINKQLSGGYAYASGGAVIIASDTKGTASSVQVQGGSANTELNFPTGVNTGTGNVADLSAVTALEAAGVINGVITGATASDDSTGHLQIETTSTGSTSSIQIDATSTASAVFGFDNAVHSGSDESSVPVIGVTAKYEGGYGNRIEIEIRDASSGITDQFDLIVYYNGANVESWANLTMDDTSTNYVETKVNNESEYIELTVLPPATRPTNGTYSLSGGDDGLLGLNDFDIIGDPVARTGIYAFDQAFDLTMLATAGFESPLVHRALIQYCDIKRDKDVYAFIAVPQGYNEVQARDYLTTASLFDITDNASILYPWVKVVNYGGQEYGGESHVLISPAPVWMGIAARLYAKHGGVYQSPAGLVNGRSRTVVGIENELVLLEDIRDTLYPNGINPWNRIRGGAFYVDGTRTLVDPNDPNKLRHMNQRMGVNHIRRDLRKALDPLRHRPTHPSVRAEAHRIITSYLSEQMALGAFASNDPELAFQVNVGEDINPPTEQNAGRLNVQIALFMVSSYDWIVVRLFASSGATAAELMEALGGSSGGGFSPEM